ncbi:MAG: DUF1345 domain-containing protein [Pseudolabrys sp.]
MNRRKKTTRPTFPVRFARLHGRLLISFALGVAVALVLLAATDWRLSTKLLAGWDSFIALYLALIYQVMLQCGVEHIRARAAEEDEGAIAILMLTCVAAIASLFAIVLEVGNAKNLPQGALLVALGTATIALSWSFVHTIFALHYAHEFYGEGRDRRTGGLNFPGRGEPDYWDFLYFSLVIAMTSQVSDVTISSKSIRHVATMHGVLAFFFNLGILALTINMVSSMI